MGQYGVTLVTEPAAEPLSLDEAKLHLRVDHAEEDSLISGLIVAARRHAEAHTNRQFVTATYRQTFDHFPPRFCLDRPRLQGVSSVTYLDTNGDPRTLASSRYRVVTDYEPGLVEPAYLVSWPDTRPVAGAVSVTFTCGYGDSASDVPGDVRAALKLIVSHLYEHREAVTETALKELPAGVDWLLGPHVYHGYR